MAGKIIADTIEGTTTTETVDGSSVTIPNSVDTKYIVNGSAKAWIDMKGTGTVAIDGSLNISSITDNATGNYRQTHINNFANNDTAFVPATNAYHTRAYDNQITYSEIRSYDSTHSAADYSRVHSTTHGDLA